MGMKGYKCFRKGLICKDKQYAENTIFEEPEANICVNGMHFCKNPMDVLDYYPLIDDNGEMCEFAEVEALDETLTNDEKKYCTKKLKIGARLSLAEFIRASFDVTYRQIKEEVESVSDKEKSGHWATLAGGDNATLAGGKHTIMISENDSKAKGGIGSLIVMVERNNEGEIVNYKAIQIDGDKYKEDTWYRLEDGEIKEVE